MDFEAYFKRKIAGKKAKDFGALFEQIFYAHCKRRGIKCTRNPDGCRRVGPKQLVQVRTPWDFTLTFAARTALLDTKTTDGKSFSHSKIEPHQVREMLDHEIAGAVAGYIVWTRETDKVFFLPATELVSLMKFRGSVTENHPGAVQLGTVNGDCGMEVSRIFKCRPKEEPRGP